MSGRNIHEAKTNGLQCGYDLEVGICGDALGLATSLAIAATTGSISGTAQDAQGLVLPEVTVTLQNTLTGVVQTIKTDSAGFYNFPAVSLGTYNVTFEKSGFEKFIKTKVVIDVDTAMRVDAALKVGSTQEQVTVSSIEAQVETQSTQMGDVIEGKTDRFRTAQWPLLYRSDGAPAWRFPLLRHRNERRCRSRRIGNFWRSAERHSVR